MKKMKVFLPFAVAALILGMGACDKKQEGSQQASNKPVSSVPAKPSIKVTAADNKTTLGLNETVQLAADKEGVTWSSSDAAVAEVSSTGLVTAKGYGSATISAKLDGHTDGKITITIERPEPTKVLHMEDAEHYAADGIWENNGRGPITTSVYSKSAASDGTCIGYFGEGDKETLKFTSDKAVKAELFITMGHNDSFPALSEIMDAKLNNAAIDLSKIGYETDGSGQGDYTFQGVSFGMFDLIAGQNVLEFTMKGNAPYLDDLNIYATSAATIAVVAAPEMEALAITNDANSLTIEAESTLQIACATAGVTYTSSNEEVATINQTGLVTAVAKGTANITVTKPGMKAARVSITVIDKLAQGEIRVEVETGTSPEDQVTFRTPYGGTEMMTNAFPVDVTLTIKFNATAAGKYNMSVNARNSTSEALNIKDCYEIKVNNTAIACDVSTEGRTFVIYDLGEATLVNGENTITVKAIAESLPNLDFFRFVPKA